jgi:hypothetical protein
VSDGDARRRIGRVGVFGFDASIGSASPSARNGGKSVERACSWAARSAAAFGPPRSISSISRTSFFAPANFRCSSARPSFPRSL